MVPVIQCTCADTGGVGPEAFQIVKTAHVIIEDMDNDIAVIHQHPVALLETIDTERLDSLCFQILLNMFGDGADLAVGRPVADEKRVRQAGEVADV